MDEKKAPTLVDIEFEPELSKKNVIRDDIVKEVSDWFFTLKKDTKSRLKTIAEDGLHGTNEYERLYSLNSAIEQMIDAREEISKDIQNKILQIDESDSCTLFYEIMGSVTQRLYNTMKASSECSVIEIPPVISIRTYRPDYFTVSNTKIQNLLFDPSTTQDFCVPKKIPLLRDSKKDNAFLKNVQCTQLINDEVLPPCLNQYDRNVFNGVCSIFEACQKDGRQQVVMTAGMVYEAFAGRGKPSKQALDKVIKSLEKMATTRVSVDWSEHAVLSNLLDEEKAKSKKGYIILKDNILHLQEIIFEVNGKETHGYQLLSIPSLYNYATKVKQIISIKKEVLAVPSIANTEDAVLIKNYMAYRVQLMKSRKNHIRNNSILFDSIYEECAIKINNAKERNRKKKLIVNILNHWTNINYISGYSLQKSGGSYRSIEIDLQTKKEKVSAGKQLKSV